MERKRLSTVVRENTKVYGSATVEDRAIPDFRDGCKPVHRRILHAMVKLGLRPNGGFVKSARIVGQTIGLYHPHGDQAVYKAMVNMANSPVSTIWGEGNWGGPVDAAAAYRYTEAKLTEYSQNFLVDPIYLKVTDYLPNFDGSDTEPLVLPAKLPNILLNGGSGIAVAVTTEIPAFEIDGVVKLVNMALDKKEITPKLCAKHLKFTAPWGIGDLISAEPQIIEFFTSGNESLAFRPKREIDLKAGTYTITSKSPGLNLGNIHTTFSKMDEVASVTDLASLESPVKLVITLRVGQRSQAKTIFENFDKKLTRRITYNINVTERRLGSEDGDHKVDFNPTTVPKILVDWVRWRIGLEIKVINYLMTQIEKDLGNIDLILIAIKHLDSLIKTIRKKHANRQDLIQSVAKLLNVSDASAQVILAMSLNTLSNLSENETLAKKKKLEKELLILKKDLKNPNKRIKKQLSQKG